MAAINALAFPVKNAACRTYFCIVDATTGNPISGAFTGATPLISLDGGAFATPAGTVTQIGTSGWGYADLTSADMNATAILFQFAVSNANAVAAKVVLLTSGPTQITGAVTIPNVAITTGRP